MTSSHVKVAAVQLTSGVDAERNVAVALDLVRRAADAGATYIQLPEYFNYYGPSAGFDRVEEPIPGPTTARVAEVARSLNAAVHIGSMLETSPVAGKSFNTSVVIDGAGEIVATYRKAHLFDIDVPDQIVYRESDAILAGEQLVVADLGRIALGLSICFDLRFPEMYRRLAVHGATVLAIPSAFSAVTGKVHWEVLVRARAIENHSFVVAAAQVGTTSEGLATYGHSMIVGPWGEVLAESDVDCEDVVAATLDMNEVARRRSQIDVLALRRPVVYDTLDDVGTPS